MLVTGAEMLVRGGGQIALALRIPALVVGLTIVAFGTSTPELAVSMTAAVTAESPAQAELALANVNGSNIANIVFVLGIAALIRPLQVQRSLMAREIPALLLLQLLVPICCIDLEISWYDGLMLIAVGAGYNFLLIRSALRGRRTTSKSEKVPVRWLFHIALLVAGICVLVGGAQLFISGAVTVAERLNFSRRFIGLTVVALGTSAPEIATAVVSSYRGNADLAVGNSIGSNILNIAMVLGLTAMIAPIQIEDLNAWRDMAVAVAATICLIPIVLRGSRLGRGTGLILAGGYIAYLFIGAR